MLLLGLLKLFEFVFDSWEFRVFEGCRDGYWGAIRTLVRMMFLVLSECRRLLWVNSIVPVFLCQVVGFEEQ
jgi:hypothetical protein